jgi:hypothetical protein
MTAEEVAQADGLIKLAAKGSPPKDGAAGATLTSISEEKLKLIEKMFALTGAKELMAEQVSLIIPAIKKAHPEIPEEFWRRCAQKMNVEELAKEIYPIYDKYFTEEDLKAFIVFYGTLAGQKLKGTLPQMMREMTRTCSQWGERVGKEVAADMEK